jgi:hypothetical protein
MDIVLDIFGSSLHPKLQHDVMPWQASSSWQQLAAASKPSPTSLEPLKYKPISTTQANPHESFEPTLKCSKHVSCKHQLIDSRIICKSKIVKGILALWNPATSLPSMLLCYGSQFFWIARLVSSKGRPHVKRGRQEATTY